MAIVDLKRIWSREIPWGTQYHQVVHVHGAPGLPYVPVLILAWKDQQIVLFTSTIADPRQNIALERN